MRVLHLLAPAAVGGLESVVRGLASGQRARGHEVHVALVLDSDPGLRHALVEPLEAAGVEVTEVRVPPRAYLRERRELGRVIGAWAPDVVHTHGYRADVLGRGPAARAGVPTVTTVHGFTGGGWRNRLYERLQRRAFRRFGAVVAVSRRLADELAGSGVPREKVHCVPNAWAPAAAPAERAAARGALGLGEGTVLGWVGRLTAEKGADVFLDAVARMGDATVTACIVGSGRDRASLEERARSLGIADRVRWTGTVPDAAHWYKAFDVFVLSSHTEGTPMALFEAMAAGVPIVTTAVGGVPDVVTPTEALLVPPGDPTALAVAVRDALARPVAARVRAARAGERLCRDYGLDPWLDRYDLVYRSLR